MSSVSVVSPAAKVAFVRVGTVVTLAIVDEAGSDLSNFARIDSSKSESPAFKAALAWSNQFSAVGQREKFFPLSSKQIGYMSLGLKEINWAWV